MLGHKGFLGSAIFAYLRKIGQDVIGVDLDNYEAMRGTPCSVLINSDGNSSKVLADKDPVLDLDMNVSSVLRAIVDFPHDQYLHISSIDVYNEQSNVDSTGEDAGIDPSRLSRYGFSKLMGELVAKKHANGCVVYRLGGMFGHNSKKGPAHDILNGLPVWVNPESRFLFLDTATVAGIVWDLRFNYGETINVTATDNLSLSEFSALVGKPICKVMGIGSVLNYRVNTEKASRMIRLPTSRESVESFVSGGC